MPACRACAFGTTTVPARPLTRTYSRVVGPRVRQRLPGQRPPAARARHEAQGPVVRRVGVEHPDRVTDPVAPRVREGGPVGVPGLGAAPGVGRPGVEARQLQVGAEHVPRALQDPGGQSRRGSRYVHPDSRQVDVCDRMRMNGRASNPLGQGPNAAPTSRRGCYQIVTKPLFSLGRSVKNSIRKSLTCGYFCLARATGLEPATTGSTVRWAEGTRGRTIAWENGTFPCPAPGCGKPPSPHEPL